MNIKKLFEYTLNGEFTVEKHPTEDLFIFGYATGPTTVNMRIKWDDMNKNMRGLIIDSNSVVHARSFRKFFTFKEYLSKKHILMNDSQIIELGSNKFNIYEKLDGSLSILYWVNDEPFMATQRSFRSLKAKKATEILHKKYNHLFHKIKKDRTYIFEAIYPESSVLINYGDEEKLVLLGILDNKTGDDLELEDIGFPIAKNWTNKLSNIDNLSKLESLNLKHLEGFVVHFDDGKRVKVKFPWYKEAHGDLNNLIFLELKKYKLERKIKKHLNFPKNVANSKSLWERFKKGETPIEIIKDFSDVYLMTEVREWLQYEYINFKKEKDINTNTSELIPQKNIEYSFSMEMKKPRNELIMWNRLEALKKKYE